MTAYVRININVEPPDAKALGEFVNRIVDAIQTDPAIKDYSIRMPITRRFIDIDMGFQP